uniref:Uncharacterized protein n=1 Tax=Anopheles dirus TaxID=7168 RepID=A0A182N0B2_9DIPT
MTDPIRYSLGGAAVRMDHFHTALDPRKQKLLEARFLGARVSHRPGRPETIYCTGTEQSGGGEN